MTTFLTCTELFHECEKNNIVSILYLGIDDKYFWFYCVCVKLFCFSTFYDNNRSYRIKTIYWCNVMDFSCVYILQAILLFITAVIRITIVYKTHNKVDLFYLRLERFCKPLYDNIILWCYQCYFKKFRRKFCQRSAIVCVRSGVSMCPRTEFDNRRTEWYGRYGYQ